MTITLLIGWTNCAQYLLFTKNLDSHVSLKKRAHFSEKSDSLLNRCPSQMNGEYGIEFLMHVRCDDWYSK